MFIIKKMKYSSFCLKLKYQLFKTLKSLNQLRGDLIIMTSRLCKTEHNFLGNTLRGRDHAREVSSKTG